MGLQAAQRAVWQVPVPQRSGMRLMLQQFRNARCHPSVLLARGGCQVISSLKKLQIDYALKMRWAWPLLQITEEHFKITVNKQDKHQTCASCSRLRLRLWLPLCEGGGSSRISSDERPRTMRRDDFGVGSSDFCIDGRGVEAAKLGEGVPLTMGFLLFHTQSTKRSSLMRACL